jgi:hypothetical protein
LSADPLERGAEYPKVVYWPGEFPISGGIVHRIYATFPSGGNQAQALKTSPTPKPFRIRFFLTKSPQRNILAMAISADRRISGCDKLQRKNIFEKVACF